MACVTAVVGGASAPKGVVTNIPLPPAQMHLGRVIFALDRAARPERREDDEWRRGDALEPEAESGDMAEPAEEEDEEEEAEDGQAVRAVSKDWGVRSARQAHLKTLAAYARATRWGLVDTVIDRSMRIELSGMCLKMQSGMISDRLPPVAVTPHTSFDGLACEHSLEQMSAERLIPMILQCSNACYQHLRWTRPTQRGQRGETFARQVLCASRVLIHVRELIQPAGRAKAAAAVVATDRFVVIIRRPVEVENPRPGEGEASYARMLSRGGVDERIGVHNLQDLQGAREYGDFVRYRVTEYKWEHAPVSQSATPSSESSSSSRAPSRTSTPMSTTPSSGSATSDRIGLHERVGFDMQDDVRAPEGALQALAKDETSPLRIVDLDFEWAVRRALRRLGTAVGAELDTGQTGATAGSVMKPSVVAVDLYAMQDVGAKVDLRGSVLNHLFEAARWQQQTARWVSYVPAGYPIPAAGPRVATRPKNVHDKWSLELTEQEKVASKVTRPLLCQ